MRTKGNPAGEPNAIQMPVVRIEPPQGWAPVNLAELWQHRDLLYYLVWRDILSLYANTGLGVLWTVLQPLSTAVVITVVLGLLARIPVGDVPYALIVLSGLVPWTYFSSAVSSGCLSMLANANLMTKVYFPRLIIPIVPILAGLVDLAVLVIVLLAASLIYGVLPRLEWLLIPVPLILAVALALGSSLWLSALNVEYRDVGRVLPILLQAWLYASPIIYPVSLVPENFQFVYSFNPIVGIVITMQWALLGTGAFPVVPLIITTGVSLVLIVSGAFVFRRMEDTMADTI